MKRILGLITSSGARDTYILTAGNFADSFIAFLFTIISFHLLSASEFGIFSAFNNLIFSVSMILDLGLSQALLYYLPRQLETDKGQTIGTAIAIRLLVASMFAFLICLFAPFLSSRFFSGSPIHLLYVSAFAIVFASLIDILIFSLQGLHKFFQSIVVSNTYSLSRLIVVGLYAYFAWRYSAINALMITVYGPIIGILLGLYLLKPKGSSINIAKKLLNFGGYMGIYKICQIIALRSDVQLVLTFLGTSIAGIYSVAARMGNFYPLILITLNSLFASRLRQNGLTTKFLHKSFILLATVLAVMVICAWQAPLIINLLFGTKAFAAGIIYRYLTLAYLPLIAASLPVAILVFYHTDTKLMGILGLLQVFVTLLLGFTLITRIGLFGPMIGLATANSLVFIVTCIKVVLLK